MPVTTDYFTNRKDAGNTALRSVLYRGDTRDGVKQFDSLETIARNLVVRLQKLEEKVKLKQQGQ